MTDWCRDDRCTIEELHEAHPIEEKKTRGRPNKVCPQCGTALLGKTCVVCGRKVEPKRRTAEDERKKLEARMGLERTASGDIKCPTCGGRGWTSNWCVGCLTCFGRGVVSKTMWLRVRERERGAK